MRLAMRANAGVNFVGIQEKDIRSAGVQTKSILCNLMVARVNTAS